MTNTKICPKCAESIQRQAKVCRFCGEKFGFSANNTGIGCAVLLLLSLGFCASVNNNIEKSEESARAARDAIPNLTSAQRAACRDILNQMRRDGTIIDHISGVLRVRRAQWGELSRDLQSNVVGGVACADYGMPVAKLSGIDQVVIIKDAATGDVLASAAEGQMMFE
jgi:hypothetical protein